MSNIVQKCLYRSLLRQARHIDRNPLLKFLVVAKPKSTFDPTKNSVITFNFDAHDLNHFIQRFTGGGQYYRPENTITEVIRTAFRSVDQELDWTELLSTAFNALKFLADVNDMSQHLQSVEVASMELPAVTEDQAALTQITQLSDVESFTGRLLITHPVSCIGQQFHRAVILLLERPDSGAVWGWIINKPNKQHRLTDLWQAEFVQTYPELAKCEVWNAGVINGLAILHTCPGIEGSLEVDMGVFVHPLEMRKSSIAAVMDQFQKAIEEKRTSVDNIKFLHGVCAWDRTQLINELERTVWFLTDSPREGIKPYLMKDSSAAERLWRSLLARFGGECVNVASAPEFPSAILHRISQGQKDAFVELLKDQ